MPSALKHRHSHPLIRGDKFWEDDRGVCLVLLPLAVPKDNVNNQVSITTLDYYSYNNPDIKL